MSDDLDDYIEEISMGRPKGPLGIDPLHFSAVLFSLLLIFVFYLLLPRGFRAHHFRAYPKRYAWSARSRASRGRRHTSLSSVNSQHIPPASTVGSSITGISQTHHRGIASTSSNPMYAPSATRRISSGLSGTSNLSPPNFDQHHPTLSQSSRLNSNTATEDVITFSSSKQQLLQKQNQSQLSQHQHQHQQQQKVVVAVAVVLLIMVILLLLLLIRQHHPCPCLIKSE